MPNFVVEKPCGEKGRPSFRMVIELQIHKTMNKDKKTAARKGGNDERVLQIVMNDQSGRYAPNVECCALLADALPLWMPANLFFKVTDALRGYSKGMATVMTECVVGFVAGTGRQLTGIQHIDDQLMSLYKEIYEFAREHGFELGIIF